MAPKKKKQDEIEGIVRSAIEDAVDFIESDMIDGWNKAQRYVDGKVDIGHEEGRSKVIASKCRDAVRAIKPPLMRAFLSSGSPVEYVPTGPEDVADAELRTSYVDFKFRQCGGYRVIYDAVHDALVKKVGIVKVSFDESEEVEIDEYTGLSDDQFALIVNDPEIEVLEHSAAVVQDELGEYMGHDLKVSRTKTGGDLKFMSVPPEDFFINPEATDIMSAFVCGHRNPDMRVTDLVEMGYDFDEVIDHAGDEDTTSTETVDQERRGYTGKDNTEKDDSMKKIMVTEAYMKMDIEGAGTAQLYRFVCIGGTYHLLDYELCDFIPFAVFEVDPEPHAFYGRSLVEIIEDDQDASTSMLRGVLDNIALTNTPGATVLEGQVNMEDMLNNEVGWVRRVKSMDAVRYEAMPFFAGAVLPALQYYDEQIENKTGITRAANGLNPDVLQNTTAAAVNAMVEAANGQVELIARNLAEGGMKQMFSLIAKLTRQHVDREVMVRLNGQFVPVDPRSWNTEMDLVANVGLGTGGEVEKEMVLREMLTHQMMIFQGFGPQNGLVTMTHIRNTLADIMKMGGIYNSDRHFSPMDPQTEQMLMQQAAQAQPQQQDPNASLAQAQVQSEQIRAQAKMQSDLAKIQAQAQADAAKLGLQAKNDEARIQAEAAKTIIEDDRERDKMLQDQIMKAAELLGQYGIKVDDARIRAMQASNGVQ